MVWHSRLTILEYITLRQMFLCGLPKRQFPSNRSLKERIKLWVGIIVQIACKPIPGDDAPAVYAGLRLRPFQQLNDPVAEHGRIEGKALQIPSHLDRKLVRVVQWFNRVSNGITFPGSQLLLLARYDPCLFLRRAHFLARDPRAVRSPARACQV